MHTIMNWLFDLFENHGIEPLSLISIFSLVLFYRLYRDDMKKWNTVTIGDKLYIIMCFSGAVFGLIFGVLRILGVIPKD